MAQLVLKLSAPTSPQPEPSEWGHICWYTLELGALAAARETPQSSKLYDWFKGFACILPCAECRQDYAEFWNINHNSLKNALSFQSVERTRDWVAKLRQHVNEKTKTRQVKKEVATLPNFAPPKKPATVTRTSRHHHRGRRRITGCASCGGLGFAN